MFSTQFISFLVFSILFSNAQSHNQSHQQQHICLLNRTCHARTELASTLPPASHTPEHACIEVESISTHRYPSETGSRIFCAYVDPHFANERGIAIITSPEIADYVNVQTPAFTNPKLFKGKNPFDHAYPSFYEAELPGKGRGLIANQTIHRGDLIFRYPPVLAMHIDAVRSASVLNQVVNKLPQKTQELFMGLHAEFGGDQVDSIINTNGFQGWFGREDELHLIILPETAVRSFSPFAIGVAYRSLDSVANQPRLSSKVSISINRRAYRLIALSLSTSSIYYFDETDMLHYVYATKTIHPGEELSLSCTSPPLFPLTHPTQFIHPKDTNPTAPSAQRRETIKNSWGFTCTCSACSQSPIHSDRRLALIDALKVKLNDWSTKSEATPATAETLISIYIQENLHSYLAEPYHLASLAYNGACDKDGAMKYGLLALEQQKLENGEGGSDIEMIKSLLYCPEEHWSWCKRARK